MLGLCVISLSRLWSIRTCSAGPMSWHAGLPSVPQCARVSMDCQSALGRSRCFRSREHRFRSRTVPHVVRVRSPWLPQQHASDTVVQRYPHAPETDRRYVWSHARIAVSGVVHPASFVPLPQLRLGRGRYSLRRPISARRVAISARSASISLACSRVRRSSAWTASRFTPSISVVVIVVSLSPSLNAAQKS